MKESTSGEEEQQERPHEQPTLRASTIAVRRITLVPPLRANRSTRQSPRGQEVQMRFQNNLGRHVVVHVTHTSQIGECTRAPFAHPLPYTQRPDDSATTGSVNLEAKCILQ